MELTPGIFTAKVMHKRMFPKVNRFVYSVYYLSLPLSRLTEIERSSVRLNRWGVLSFYEKDHGPRDGSCLRAWMHNILCEYNIDADVIDDIILVSLPRVLGYVFNPVSFFLCIDSKQKIRAVLCEVNNTFGESHSYLCRHADLRPIKGDDILNAEKLFHVSPFLEREGSYQFRFSDQDGKLGVWIDFFDASGQKKLLTSLTGTIAPMTKKTVRQALISHPLVTFKTIALIHYQAIKILCKGIKHIVKPTQLEQKSSATSHPSKKDDKDAWRNSA